MPSGGVHPIAKGRKRSSGRRPNSDHHRQRVNACGAEEPPPWVGLRGYPRASGGGISGCPARTISTFASPRTIVSDPPGAVAHAEPPGRGLEPISFAVPDEQAIADVQRVEMEDVGIAFVPSPILKIASQPL
jgi:hypothetical protein